MKFKDERLDFMNYLCDRCIGEKLSGFLDSLDFFYGLDSDLEIARNKYSDLQKKMPACRDSFLLTWEIFFEFLLNKSGDLFNRLIFNLKTCNKISEININ